MHAGAMSTQLSAKELVERYRKLQQQAKALKDKYDVALETNSELQARLAEKGSKENQSAQGGGSADGQENTPEVEQLKATLASRDSEKEEMNTRMKEVISRFRKLQDQNRLLKERDAEAQSFKVLTLKKEKEGGGTTDSPDDAAQQIQALQAKLEELQHDGAGAGPSSSEVRVGCLLLQLLHASPRAAAIRFGLSRRWGV